MTGQRRPILHAITEHTHAEWPADHPLRRLTVVIPDDLLPADAILICSDLGERRLPASAGDHDVTGTCSDCGRAILWRASAPKHLRHICVACWKKLTGVKG